MSKAALFLFNKTPAMPKPWADAGYLCYCVDIQHPKGERREGNIVWVGADVHRYVPLFSFCYLALFALHDGFRNWMNRQTWGSLWASVRRLAAAPGADGELSHG